MRSSSPARALACAGLLLACACSKRKSEPSETRPAAVVPAPAPVADAGPVVRPVATSHAVTFAVPRGGGWWLGIGMACYNALASASPGFSAMDMLAMQYPSLGPALRAAGLDLQRDLVAAGAFACGGEACLYAAVALEKPDGVAEVLKGLGTRGDRDLEVRRLDAGHHTVRVQGARGPRTVHLRVVPVDWAGVKVPDEPWARDARRATHVVFLYGVDEGKPAPDPLEALAEPAAAAARVREVEALLADSRGRCVAGALAPNEEIKPGTRVLSARFAAAAPPRSADDVAAAALGSPRSIDVEVVLELSPAPTAEKVAQWIDEARAFVQQTFAPLLPQLTVSLGPLGEQIVRALGVLAEAGFQHRLDGASLRLSFATTRITRAQLEAAGL